MRECFSLPLPLVIKEQCCSMDCKELDQTREGASGADEQFYTEDPGRKTRLGFRGGHFYCGKRQAYHSSHLETLNAFRWRYE